MQNIISILGAGITSLINDFPYPHYTDDEIVSMFINCDSLLGANDKIRLKVVQHFRSLTKHNLTIVLHGILDKLSSDKNTDSIDLSEELLPLGILLNIK
jgi:hypothetical protein